MRSLRQVSVHSCVCGDIWQVCWSTPISDSALPSCSVRLWHAFKRAVPTKRPIECNFPCVSSLLNPRGTWLLNPIKSNESQETTSVSPSSFPPRSVKHPHNTDFSNFIFNTFIAGTRLYMSVKSCAIKLRLGLVIMSSVFIPIMPSSPIRFTSSQRFHLSLKEQACECRSEEEESCSKYDILLSLFPNWSEMDSDHVDGRRPDFKTKQHIW